MREGPQYEYYTNLYHNNQHHNLKLLRLVLHLAVRVPVTVIFGYRDKSIAL